MFKRKHLLTNFYMGVALFLTIVTPLAVSRLIDTEQLALAIQVARLGMMGILFASMLYAGRLAREWSRITDDVLADYKKLIAEYKELSELAKRAVEAGEERTPAVKLVRAMLDKIKAKEDFLALDDLATSRQILKEGKDDYPTVMAALQSDLERMIDTYFPAHRRQRGRPAGLIYPPGFEKKGLPVKDALPGLAELQLEKENGKLRKTGQVTRNPWGGPPIPYRTAYGWLDTYQEDIAEYLRNSTE